MTDAIFSKHSTLKSALSPYNDYCVGYPAEGSYITALVMGAGAVKSAFGHPGSNILDGIIAYDRAEISDAYIGQINMIMVSSFCGPQGLIWGYDLAKEESVGLSSLISPEKVKEFKGIEVRNGQNLRRAAKSLFGTLEKKRFPFLPGSHVPCAGKWHTKTGPALLYGVSAIGIPADRGKAACLFMEDVGEVSAGTDNTESMKEKIILNTIRSVLQVGKDQGITYKEIFVDYISKEIKSGEMGCVLIAIPYFLLAKKAVESEKIIREI